MPLAIPIAAMLMVRERVVAGQWLGLAISFLGVVWIVARGEPATLAAFRIAPGDLWVLLAVANWAVYSSLLRFKPPEMNPGVLMIATMAVGMVVLAPFMLWESAQGRTVPVTPQALAAVAYVAVFASLVAYLCWNRSVALLGPTRTGLSIHMMPVLVGVLAFTHPGRADRRLPPGRCRLHRGRNRAGDARGLDPPRTRAEPPQAPEPPSAFGKNNCSPPRVKDAMASCPSVEVIQSMNACAASTLTCGKRSGSTAITP